MLNYYNYMDMFLPEEILLYLRKSRSDDPMFSVEEVLAKHEAMLNEWCMKNLGQLIPESNRYREVVSGESIEDRIEFQKLLKKVESPKIKAVLVVEIQRLGRPDLEEIGKITKIFRFTGITVITPMRAYNIQDEYDRDYFERELKRGNEYLEYQKKIMGRGRLLSVSQGNYIGSLPPYGYNKVWLVEDKKKCPTLEENKEQADIVRMIFDMYVNKDMGVHSIGKYLDNLHIKPPKGKHWSPNAMKDMLSNVHYIGKVKWNWRKTVTIVEDSEIVKTRPKSQMGDFLVYDGKHPAIISEELFDAAQEKRGRCHRAKPATTIKNPLASILYCRCGRAMTLRTYKKKDGTERTPPRFVCDDQSHCGAGSCLYDEMIERLCDMLEQLISDFTVEQKSESNDSMKLHEKLIKNLEAKLKELELREFSQWEAQTSPNLDERVPPEIFKQLNEKVIREKEETKKALEEAYNTLPKPVDYDDAIYTFSEGLKALRDDSIDAERKNKLLKACFKRIEYYRDTPQRVRRKEGEKKGSLPAGASWTTPPIEVDIQLNVKRG